MKILMQINKIDLKNRLRTHFYILMKEESK
jgi:hypothetical protein